MLHSGTGVATHTMSYHHGDLLTWLHGPLLTDRLEHYIYIFVTKTIFFFLKQQTL